MWTLLLAFFLSFSLALYGTPVARRAALEFGIVDRPDGRLKTQREPVPYLGGLAVFLSFLLTLAVVYEFNQQVLGVLLGAAILLLVGLLDDLHALSPLVKLLGQILAVVAVVKAGVVIEVIYLPRFLAVLLSAFWLLTLINALNIIDVHDGLAAGVGYIAALFLFSVAYLNGRTMIAVLALALAGSLLGFLRFNLPPARIYLGDTGSLLLGLVLGSLALTGSYTGQSLLGILSPILILGVPLFDLVLVMVMRYRQGVPVFQGSHDHFAVRLRRAGLSPVLVLAIAYVAGVLFGLGGLSLMRSPDPRLAGLVVLVMLMASLAAGVGLARVGVAGPSPLGVRPAPSGSRVGD